MKAVLAGPFTFFHLLAEALYCRYWPSNKVVNDTSVKLAKAVTTDRVTFTHLPVPELYCKNCPLAKIYYGTYSPPAGSLSLTGRAPTIVYGISYPPSGSVAITGYPPVSGIGGYWITEEDLVTIITDESGNLLVTE